MKIGTLKSVLSVCIRLSRNAVYAFFVIVYGMSLLTAPVLADTVDLEFSYGFPSFGGGPVGCSIMMDREACTSEPLTIIPDVDVEVLAGFAEVKYSQIRPPNCVVITVRLWVDHKGYEGRECLAPFAHAIAHVKIP
jgi:hypothetical protein